jgi:hypothetical protein
MIILVIVLAMGAFVATWDHNRKPDITSRSKAAWLAGCWGVVMLAGAAIWLIARAQMLPK